MRTIELLRQPLRGELKGDLMTMKHCLSQISCFDTPFIDTSQEGRLCLLLCSVYSQDAEGR